MPAQHAVRTPLHKIDRIRAEARRYVAWLHCRRARSMSKCHCRVLDGTNGNLVRLGRCEAVSCWQSDSVADVVKGSPPQRHRQCSTGVGGLTRSLSSLPPGREHIGTVRRIFSARGIHRPPEPTLPPHYPREPRIQKEVAVTLIPSGLHTVKVLTLDSIEIQRKHP